MADLKAPQPAPKWTHSPEEVRATAEQLIAADQEALDAIASLPPAKCNFDTVSTIRMRRMSHSGSRCNSRFEVFVRIVYTLDVCANA